MLHFLRTGFSKDKTGRVRTTGFEVRIGPFRVNTFPVPTKVFGVMNRRVAIELGPIHALLTWRRRGT